jgi:molecular chaperone HtpG
MKREHREDYAQFWQQFGPALKEGLAGYDTPDKDRLLDLVVAPSTHDTTTVTSLDDYVGRMKEGQDAIYFLSGASKDAVARSPLLEGFRAKGYEVLLFSDAIDELWLERAPRFKDKQLVSIGRGDVKPGSEDEQKQAAAELEDKQREFSALLTALRVHLQDEVKDVRLSSRLTSSASCLVSDADDMTPRMQKIFEQLGQAVPSAKPVLELNPAHPVFPKLQVMFTESSADPRLATYARLLLGQAYLADTGTVPDPVAFGAALAELMLHG